MKCDQECMDFIQSLFDLLEPNGQTNLTDDEMYKDLERIKVIK